MKIKFLPLDFDAISVDGQGYIKIFGKTNEGKSCCIIDRAINFFYVLAKNPDGLLGKVKGISGVNEAEIVSKNYLEKSVKALKIYCEYNYMEDITREIKGIVNEIETRERDINQITRYIIEKDIKPLVWYEITGTSIDDSPLFRNLTNSLDTDVIIRLEKSVELEKQLDFEPRVLAFDIEVEEFEIGRGRILMISLVSDNFRKVLTWRRTKVARDYVEFCKDEKEMLKKFMQCIKIVGPDIITGYFSDGFDLPYLKARAELNGVDLQLGTAKSKVQLSRGRPINAKIDGLVHIDLLKFVETIYSQYMQSETLSLNDVAQELLGEGKLNVNHNKQIHEYKEEEWEQFFEYNLHDSVLTFKLFHKLWHDIQEFTRIIQEPLFTITRQSMSSLVESYILHNLNRFNEISERKPIHDEIQKRRDREKYEGAFVLQPTAALYENIAIFDFTSMYASIIVSFNFSLPTLRKEKYDNFEVDLGKPGKVYFSKAQGFIPKLLEEIIKLRKRYKKELREQPNPITKARSNAFKLLANAYYGYQGFFGARYYCPEAAASTAALARKFIKEAIERAKEGGYEVIYADTDSIALLFGKRKKQETLDFLKKLNSELPGIMELELEDFYRRGIWVTKRTGEFGAKKKYALVNWEGKLKIRGFETVRRDWCILAKEVQSKVLQSILGEGNADNALDYVKKIIENIKKKDVKKEKLIIRTQLKKSLETYDAIGPHVLIAKKMLEKGIPVRAGSLIEYIIAESQGKKGPIRDKAKLPEEMQDKEYDSDYYIRHQILPAVENIFSVFGISEDEILLSEQKKLGSFW